VERRYLTSLRIGISDSAIFRRRKAEEEDGGERVTNIIS